MQVDVKVFRWDGLTWAGWWSDDNTEPHVYEDVLLRQYDNSNLIIGQGFMLDIPNGHDWSPAERGLDRHYLEGATVDFYSGDFTLEGFVRVEHFGPDFEEDDGADGDRYSKQRWVVKVRR